MTPISVPSNGTSIFRLAGKDDSEQTRDITGSATIDDFAKAYFAKVAGTGNQYMFVSRGGTTVAAGTTAAVNVTVNALDDLGNPVTPFVIPFAIIGPALPPPATHVVISEGPFGADKGSTTPADPGSATISL